MLCLSNSCFAFWSNWITKLANTVISVTQISSTGYVSGKPVNALDSFLFPGMGCMSLKALRVLVFWYFYQKFRLPFCEEKAESKMSRELHLRLLKSKQRILIPLWFWSRHWWGSCFYICVVAWLSLSFLYWTFASRFSYDYPFSYDMRAGQRKCCGSYTTGRLTDRVIPPRSPDRSRRHRKKRSDQSMAFCLVSQDHLHLSSKKTPELLADTHSAVGLWGKGRKLRVWMDIRSVPTKMNPGP